MEPAHSRICVSYIITTFLLACLAFLLFTSFLRTAKKAEQLASNVNDMGMVLSQGGCNTADNEVKQCLSNLLNEIDSIKKQIGQGCSNEAPALTTGGCGGGGCALADIAHSNGMNYASEELGAKIEDVVGEPIAPYGWIRAFLGMKYSANPPINMLRNSMKPGNCFAFRNASAAVTVKLSKEIFVELFELEHICKERMTDNDISNAPRDFEVLYIESCRKERSFGKFVFENKVPVQYYQVKSEAKAQYVRFKFLSNHGNPAFTCVYKVAVYGKENI